MLQILIERALKLPHPPICIMMTAYGTTQTAIEAMKLGALDYLTTYPYGCTEQTMSSFLPNIIVAQVLKDVKSASISDSANARRVR